jgi:hypothetical protein
VERNDLRDVGLPTRLEEERRAKARKRKKRQRFLAKIEKERKILQQFLEKIQKVAQNRVTGEPTVSLADILPPPSR